MKKTLLLTCIIALVFALIPNNSLSAQNGDYKQNIYVGTGFSLVGAGFRLLNVVEGNSDNSFLPAIQLTYDYALTPKISAGLGFSYQSFGFDIENYPFTDENGNIIVENFTADLARTNIAGRVLFHYSKNEKLDMYSGIRIGLSHWKTSTESTSGVVEDFLEDSFEGWGFAPQLVAFGLRYYVTDNIGLSFESTIGEPHFLSIGANYRL